MSLNLPIRDWRGRRVWIVGASTGIGAALAERLAAAGARVALSARRERMLRDVAARCGPEALVLPMDVTEASAFPAAMLQILDAWGGLDLAVFNAATYEPLRAWELTADNARKAVHTNLLGVMDGVAAVLPQFLRHGEGGVAIVASVAGYRGLPKALTYGPMKAALINFAETLYLDLAPQGVSVFLVNPGFVATPLTERSDSRLPALISADEAAAEIVAGFADGSFEIHFPKRFTRMMKTLQHLPHRLYFRLVSRGSGP